MILITQQYTKRYKTKKRLSSYLRDNVYRKLAHIYIGLDKIIILLNHDEMNKYVVILSTLWVLDS